MKKLLALWLCLLIASSARATEAPDFNLPGLSGERVQLTALLKKPLGAGGRARRAVAPLNG